MILNDLAIISNFMILGAIMTDLTILSEIAIISDITSMSYFRFLICKIAEMLKIEGARKRMRNKG